jgi:asparagine synthase (glutamine-hydrolysing)
MSAQFGRCHFDGKPVHQADFGETPVLLATYGFGTVQSLCQNNVCIFYAPLELEPKCQPVVLSSGNVLTFVGRLDNKADLAQELCYGQPAEDVEIVCAAFERWGTRCLGKLVGDWCLSVWMPRTRSLLLAKDAIGTRPLYYLFDEQGVTWSSALELLLRSSRRTFALNEEFVAGWLSLFPASHLSPFAGVHSVPPASYVLLNACHRVVHEYWHFNPGKEIRYRNDGEYEEHFRTVFANAVARRLRSHHPVLAELSGGMDSSSIVCVADTLISAGRSVTPRLDTISYYNDSEPNWNERPYFTKVEERRGRTGWHVDLGLSSNFAGAYRSDRLVPIPGSGADPLIQDNFTACLTTQENRVVLSGIGGDEVLGGVPNCVPELADLLSNGDLRNLLPRTIDWALARRKPVLHLTLEVLREFLPSGLGGLEKAKRPLSWLEPAFATKYKDALSGYRLRMRLTGARPSFQENVRTLDLLRRQIACSVLPTAPPYEKRYPYLDRDLLEFLFAIPREQIVRPTQRRSLMRRALNGVVPAEILLRKRKAFVARAPVRSLIANWPDLMETCSDMMSGALGIVNAECFHEALRQTRNGQPISLSRLMRTLDFEYWLRHIQSFQVLQFSQLANRFQLSSAPTVHRFRRA